MTHDHPEAQANEAFGCEQLAAQVKELERSLEIAQRLNLVYQVQFAEAKARIAELEPAAECWDAIASCYRITCMGFAGLGDVRGATLPRTAGYAHATFNLWTTAGSGPLGATGDEQDLLGRDVLSHFVSRAIANGKMSKATEAGGTRDNADSASKAAPNAGGLSVPGDSNIAEVVS